MKHPDAVGRKFIDSSLKNRSKMHSALVILSLMPFVLAAPAPVDLTELCKAREQLHPPRLCICIPSE